jgi:RNA polymerase primary sigma factor
MRDEEFLYGRFAGQFALLTPEQEVELANRIKTGDESAIGELVSANMRLVIKIANDYTGHGLELPDLCSEGSIGLMTAAKRFDPSFGAKFSTYAAFWIKQAIKRALCNLSRTIRVPVHAFDKLYRVGHVEKELTTRLGRDPTEAELASEVGMTEEALSHLRAVSSPIDSLDRKLNDEEDSSAIMDIIAAPEQELPKEYDLNGIGMPELLNSLDLRSKRVLIMRFGLNGATPKTLDEIAVIMGVTRERVRQIEFRTLRTLRQRLNYWKAIEVAEDAHD